MTNGIRRNLLGTDSASILDQLLRGVKQDRSTGEKGGLLDPTSLSGTRPGSNGLLGLLNELERAFPPPSTQNALAAVFAPRPLPTMPAPFPAPQPVRRKVFFSFHYDDVCRTVQVRQSWRFRPGWSNPSDNFYDKSLWEASRTENEQYLKGLIRRAMTGSTVTCVLAGSETWNRPYVRYEIAHSLFKRSGLFTIHIHNVRHPRKGMSAQGPDPLGFMGLVLRENGTGRVVEWVDGKWQYFELMKMPVPWPKWLPKPSVGWVHPLNLGTTAFDYVLDDGHANLPRWAQTAAEAAGRR